MSGRIEIEMPDGTIIDAPEGTTRAQIEMKLKGGTVAAAEPEHPIVRAAKVGGSALLRGALSVPALAVDAWGVLNRSAMGKDPFEDPLRSTAAVGQLGAKPSTTGEKYAAAGLEGLAGALGPGMVTAPVRAGMVGLSSGLGSEASAHLFGDKLLPRLLGGLAGGSTVGLASGLSRTRADLAREAMRDASPQDMRAAAGLMQEAQQEGVSLSLAQAMGRPSNLDKTVEALAQSRHGVETTRQLRNQPNDVAMLGDRQVAGLPGAVRSPSDAATNLQEAASASIEALKKQRTQLWQDTLAAGVKALQDSKQPAIQAAQAGLASARGGTQKADAGVQAALAGQAQARQALESQLPALEKALAASKDADAASVKAANDAVARTLEQIRNLRSFDLPRGQATTNRGSLLELPGRGASIDLDVASREGRAAALEKVIPPAVQDAPSATTLLMEKQLADLNQRIAGVGTANITHAQNALTTARGAEVAAAADLARAEGRLAAVTRLPEPLVGKEVNRLKALAAKTPNTPEAELLNSLANDLMVNGKPMTDPNALNQVLKATGAKLTQPNLATQGVDAGTVKYIKLQIAKVRERLGEAFKPYRDANAGYEAFTEGTLNPTRGSVVGRVAGARGFDASKELAPTRMNALFDAGTVPGSTKSDILTLEKAVRGQPNGPEAFQDAAKTWLAQKAAKAVKGSGGWTDEGTAARLVDSLIGDRTKEAGLQDTMVALARSKGLPDNALAPGMMTVMRIIQAASRRPANVAGTTTGQLDEASRSRLVSGVQSLSLIQPFRQVARAVNDSLNADAYKFMDRLVTTPEGVETLIKLGKQPVMSKAAANTLSTFLATSATAAPRGQESK